MAFQRSSGVLLHPTSLPGPNGIGELGRAALAFVDFLAESKTRLWQVLPLGPTGYGDSPYQCFSAFAGNPYLISLEQLKADGLLSDADLQDRPEFSHGRVDFGELIPWKLDVLDRAYQRYAANSFAPLKESVEGFRSRSAAWLDDFALFMALKHAHGGGAWDGWPAELRKRHADTLAAARAQHAEAISRVIFQQFLFDSQWTKVREHAHTRGVRIIGDAPIFVAYDSADVWAHPELFYLDEADRPTVVAGVPPDLFSSTGQLWGNPLYRWDAHKAERYAWWIARMRATLETVDIIRLDHFRGFAGYWEIPAGSPTAETGRWMSGPAEEFFDVLAADLKGGDSAMQLPLIAEDLGVITDDVVSLRERYDLPGMKILQFAFSDANNPFLPHNYSSNCVAYTGTHDNDTCKGWYESAAPAEKDFATRYLDTRSGSFSQDMIRAIWGSVADLAIAPMQDFLDLGTEARMNFPGTLGGNWDWRLRDGQLTHELAARLGELNDLYRR